MISTMMRTVRTEPTAVPGVFPSAAACAAGGRTSKATVGVGEPDAQAVPVGAAVPAAVWDGEAVPVGEAVAEGDAVGVQAELAAG
jgi:hypothetical protein